MRFILLTAMMATVSVGLLNAPKAGSRAADVARPNILFIMVDEMKWNVMSCAGHPIVKIPNLDRLADEGTRFAPMLLAVIVFAPAIATAAAEKLNITPTETWSNVFGGRDVEFHYRLAGAPEVGRRGKVGVAA